MSTNTITKPSISQHKFRKYQELSAAVKEFEALKAELIELIEEGAIQQQGPLGGVIVEKVRTATSWKSEYIAVASEDAAKAISKRDKGNSVSRSLVVGARK